MINSFMNALIEFLIGQPFICIWLTVFIYTSNYKLFIYFCKVSLLFFKIVIVLRAEVRILTSVKTKCYQKAIAR